MHVLTYMCMCSHICGIYGEQRTTSGSRFSSSAMFVPGFKITCSAWQQVPLPPEHLSARIFIKTTLKEENYSPSEDSTSHVEERLSFGSCRTSDPVGVGGVAGLLT